LVVDKAGVAFLVLNCILLALVLRTLMFDPGVETAQPDLPAMVLAN
jgi:hypothetical protein